jgi:RsiW-degrading membrane proteinase PrsW (M82 family)
MNLTPFVLILISPLLAMLFVRTSYRHGSKDDQSLMLLSFVAGLIMFIPSILLFYLADWMDLASDRSFKRTIFTSFIVLAGIEELIKFIAIRFFISRKNAFDKPIKGILFTIVLGLGFTTAYNLYFVLSNGAIHFSELKGFTLPFAHIIFSIFLGFFISFGKFRKGRHLEPFIGLSSAVFFHGLYEFSLFTESTDLLIGLSIGCVLMSLILLRKGYLTNTDDLNHIKINNPRR